MHLSVLCVCIVQSNFGQARAVALQVSSAPLVGCIYCHNESVYSVSFVEPPPPHTHTRTHAHTHTRVSQPSAPLPAPACCLGLPTQCSEVSGPHTAADRGLLKPAMRGSS